MTDKLDDKLVEVITQLQHGLTAVGDKIYQATPQAVDALLAVKQIEGISAIVYGMLGFVGLYAAYSLLKFANGYVERQKKIPHGSCAMVAILTVISTIDIWCNLINIWNWVAIFNPKIAIAHDILTAMKGNK